MGIPCIETIQDCGWDYADAIALSSLFVSVIGVFVNAGVAWWIVRTVQNGLNDRRVLKDHFIQEVLGVRTMFETFLQDLSAGQIRPKDVLRWFKQTNIKVDALLNFINQRYNLESSLLRPYQIDLREMITNDQKFISAFSSNTKLSVSTSLTRELYAFVSENGHLFNKVIIGINDA